MVHLPGISERSAHLTISKNGAKHSGRDSTEIIMGKAFSGSGRQRSDRASAPLSAIDTSLSVGGHHYSYLRLSTGLARAARMMLPGRLSGGL